MSLNIFEVGDRLTERALRVDARAISRGDVLPRSAEGRTTYPRYFSRASGAHIWDVDGNRFVDLLMGYGPVILGHADPDINAAVIDEMSQGTCFAPLWSPRQVELIELLCSIIPGAQRGLVLKTGSDATSAAVRLARIHTGRQIVLRSGYNGWHDWSVDQRAGIPPAVRSTSVRFDGTDLADLERLLDQYSGSVACVIMMPFEDDITTSRHLHAVRSAVHRAGALLVFDEMRSGFRIALGGAQEHLGVQADLATFSKALANGHTISALTGSAEVIDGLAHTKTSSSFHTNPGDMAAAIATVTKLRDTDALTRIWALGETFIDGLRQAVVDAGVSAEVVGYPPSPFLRFTDPDPARRDETAGRFHRRVVRGGILLHPDHQWFISAAHTADDLDEALGVCSRALAEL